MKSKKIFVIIICLIAMQPLINAQNVGINPTGAAPNASAMLDVSATNKGLLIPRVGLSATNSTNPVGAGVATSLLVYNTATAGVSPNNVTPGYYFWDGTKWVRLMDANATTDDPWLIDGNSNIVDGTNFLGTTNNVPLNFRVNDQKAGRITSAGISIFGYQAGNANSSNDLTAFGAYALLANTSGSENTAIGYRSQTTSTTSSYNTSVGAHSLMNNTTGTYNTAIGTRSLSENTSGYRNTALGYQSLNSNTSGYWNLAAGYNALNSSTTGYGNTGLGYMALQANSSGYYNTAVGTQALYYNTSGTYNTAMGRSSLSSNRANSRSTAIGFEAMYYADSRFTGRETYNTAVGYHALFGSTTATNNSGRWNTAVGDQALNSNTSGSYNSALGSDALYSNTIGQQNVVIGWNALYSNTTGSYNVIVGSQNMWAWTGAEGITAVGFQAGGNNLMVNSGENSTFIGRLAAPNAAGYINVTAIGYQAIATSSDQVRLGNADVKSLYCQGAYSATTSDPPNVHVAANGQILRSTAASGGGNDDDWLPHGAANTDPIYHEGHVYTQSLNNVAIVGTNAFATIQDAINSLPATGGKVLVTAGTWNVTTNITFPNDNITIEGVGKSTIVESASNANIFYVASRDNIEIKNMTIRYSTYDAGSTLRNAIRFYRTANCLITNCHIENARAGVHFYGSSTKHAEKNRIENNTVHNCYYGIYNGAGITSSTYYYTRRNLICNNIITNCYTRAIIISGNSAANTISGNEIMGTTTGISIFHSDSTLIHNNRISKISGGTTELGINVQGSSHTQITDNHISDLNAGSVSNSSGIRVIQENSVWCYNTSITGNQIYLNGTMTGIRVTAPIGAVISNNYIKNTNANNAYSAIYVVGTSSGSAGLYHPRNVVITNNVIHSSVTASSSSDNYSGILLKGNTSDTNNGPLQCVVSNNTVRGYGRGITVRYGENVIIQGNVASDNNYPLTFTNNINSTIIGNNSSGHGFTTVGSSGQIGYNQ